MGKHVRVKFAYWDLLRGFTVSSAQKGAKERGTQWGAKARGIRFKGEGGGRREGQRAPGQ